MRTLATVATLLLTLGSNAHAWLAQPAEGGAQSVVRDSAGNFAAAGAFGSPYGNPQHLVVAEFLSADGTLRWQHSIDGAIPVTFGQTANAATSVTTDASGDVVAGGTLVRSDFKQDATVLKLAGTDGTELWRTTIGVARGAALVRVEPTGDVIGAISDFGGVPDQRFTVFRLAGATGTSLWQRNVLFDANDSAGAAFSLDVGSDVVVGGSLKAGTSAAVVKLSLADGAEVWRYVTALQGPMVRVTRDGAGDVLAVGGIYIGGGSAIAAIKLDGATGTELWRTIIPGPALSDGTAGSVLAATPAGDVFVGGSLPRHPGDTQSQSQFLVAKLAGATGAEMWRSGLSHGSVTDLVIDASSGDPIAVGEQRHRFVGVRLRAADGHRVWSLAMSGSGGRAAGFATARSVVLDAAGNPVIAGVAGGKPPGVLKRALSFTVAKVCRQNGRIKNTLSCPP